MKKIIVSIFICALTVAISVSVGGCNNKPGISNERQPAATKPTYVISEQDGTGVINEYNGEAEDGKFVVPDEVEGVPINGVYLNTPPALNGVTSIELPDGVTYGGGENVADLQEFIVSDSNTTYKVVDGVLFSKDGTKLVAFPCGKTGTYTVPDGVTDIGNAFAYSNLTKVIVPDSVERFEERAFYQCTYLTSIVMPSNLTYIGVEAFGGCTSLKTFTVPEGVKTIDGYCFRDCISLRTLNLPASLESVDVTFLKGFDSVLTNCTALEEINVASGNAKYYSENGMLYNKDSGKMIYFPYNKH